MGYRWVSHGAGDDFLIPSPTVKIQYFILTDAEQLRLVWNDRSYTHDRWTFSLD